MQLLFFPVENICEGELHVPSFLHAFPDSWTVVRLERLPLSLVLSDPFPRAVSLLWLISIKVGLKAACGGSGQCCAGCNMQELII